MEVMEVIYDYPDQFAGKTIELTGFVYNDPNNKDSQFLFRFGIITVSQIPESTVS